MEDIRENRKFNFGYEDTDKKIEISLYGLDFEIKNIESIEEYENIDKDNSDLVEKQLEKILGEGAIEKINNKRIKDGYEKMNLNIELNIFACIFETYAKEMTNGILNKVLNTTNDINNNINSISNINREQRRNYNRNNYRENNYRGNRRNYRRY